MIVAFRDGQRSAPRLTAASHYRPRVESLEERVVPTGGPPPQGFLFTPVTTALAMHIHPHLTIIIDGQNVPIPAGIGLHPQGDYPIHTHDSSGILHVESPVRYDFTLQDFFTIWGQPFSSQQILGFRADAAHPISFTVDGQPSTAFGNLILQDHQNIVIVAGGPADANQRFVVWLYRDLLHREVDPASLGMFTLALDEGQQNRAQVVAALVGSQEYRTEVTEGLYHQLLNRDATPKELAAGLAFLAPGGREEQLEAQLMGTSEYFQNRGGNTAGGFLTAVFHDVLGRPLDAAAMRAWKKALSQGTTLTTAAAAILTSPEADTRLVKDLFQQFLHRPADPNGLNALVGALQHGMSPEGALTFLLSSEEYFDRV